MLRTTRLAGLVNTLDPKLVAAAFGMRPEGAMSLSRPIPSTVADFLTNLPAKLTAELVLFRRNLARSGEQVRFADAAVGGDHDAGFK